MHVCMCVCEYLCVCVSVCVCVLEISYTQCRGAEPARPPILARRGRSQIDPGVDLSLEKAYILTGSDHLERGGAKRGGAERGRATRGGAKRGGAKRGGAGRCRAYGF